MSHDPRADRELALLDRAGAGLAEVLRRVQDCRSAGIDTLDAADLVIDAQSQIRTAIEERGRVLSDSECLSDRRAHLAMSL